MGAILTSIRIDYPIYMHILNTKPRKKTNSEFLYMLIESCGEVIKDVNYIPSYRLRPFTIKLEKNTIAKLDELRHEIGISRSDIIRRLIFARAKKLC